jgi:hypothetical protein
MNTFLYLLIGGYVAFSLSRDIDTLAKRRRDRSRLLITRFSVGGTNMMGNCEEYVTHNFEARS